MNKYTPIPFRKGNKLLRKYIEPFVDCVGNKAMITYCDYIDKKGKTILRYTLYVKWVV